MPRILFLHGLWLPPAVYEKGLMGCLLQKLKERGFECVFVKSQRQNRRVQDSPLWNDIIRDQNYVHQTEENDHPEWYNVIQLEDGCKRFDGLGNTLFKLRHFLSREAPFDVVVGHSQGAQLATILTLMAESEPYWIDQDKKWKLVVCLNGPNSFETEMGLADRVSKHGKIRTPSLHVFGGPTDLCFEGQQKMKEVHFGDDFLTRVVRHDEGHWPPKDPKVCEKVVRAIERLLEESGCLKGEPLTF